MNVEIVKIAERNKVKLDKQKGIYNNGEDNAYPQRVERIINASVTAKTGVNMLRKFIVGNGFEDELINSAVVNSNLMGETTVYRLLSQISNSIAKHGGAFVQVQWDANGKITALQNIPYRYCRFGKEDSIGYSGKIHISENWTDRSNFKIQDVQCVDAFNPIPEVINIQLQTDHWSGQIANFRLDDEFIYPLAPVDPALEDADTEAQISQFKNGELRGGFFAKYIVYHTAFENRQDKDEFKSELKKFQGGSHESSLLLAPGTFDEDGTFKKETNFQIVKLEQNINDKIFESYETSVSNNIRKSLFAIPKILIDTAESALFGQSGSAFVEAVNFYNSQTEELRVQVAQWLQSILKFSVNDYLATANYQIKKLSYGTVDVGGTAAI